MVARLTTAINVANSAYAILQRERAFDQQELRIDEGWDMRAHIGIQPLLLALAMELALKAWFVLDHDTEKIIRSHKLSKLFAGLKPESQGKLDFEFRQSVAPLHPNFLHLDYGIQNVLTQHEDAFIDWRYTFETKNTSFEKSVFVATLEMVLSEFNKRYHIEDVPPIEPEK